MITVSLQDNKFVVSGAIKLGYIGRFRDSMIEILDSIDEVRKWPEIQYRASGDISDEQLVEILNIYLNEVISNIDVNLKIINNQFLYNLFTDMCNCQIAYWEIEEITNSKKLPKYLETVYDDFEISDLDPLKDDIEEKIKEAFPSFNLKAFINNIIPEHFTFSHDSFSFQCSDGFGGDILCAAYDEVDSKCHFTEWHNW